MLLPSGALPDTARKVGLAQMLQARLWLDSVSLVLIELFCHCASGYLIQRN